MQRTLAPVKISGRTLVAAVLLLPIWPTAARAHQIDAPPRSPGVNRSSATPADEPSPLAGSTALKLEHMREDERRKRLRSDTEKLLRLSEELKEQVDRASKDELSLDVVRKAAEIEKLAHDVKEHMKT